MPRDFTGKRYWVIGASEGLGRAVARELSAAGAHLVISARGREGLEALARELPGPAQVLPCDVTDAGAMEEAAEEAGDLDGVAFFAGVYWPMAATEWDAGQANTMADVNFTGAVRTMGAVVPRMVARGGGHILLTGSLSGFRGLPGAIGYAASKAGVMVLAQSMAIDLRSAGVEVQLANPGFIRTRLTDKNDFRMPFLMEPEAAGRIVFRHMQGHRFARSFPRGFSMVFRAGRFVPDRLWMRLFG